MFVCVLGWGEGRGGGGGGVGVGGGGGGGALFYFCKYLKFYVSGRKEN